MAGPLVADTGGLLRAVTRRPDGRPLFDPGTTLEYHPATPDDILRAIQLDQKFHELEFGLADGVVAALAERLRIDRRRQRRESYGPSQVSSGVGRRAGLEVLTRYAERGASAEFRPGVSGQPRPAQ